MQHPPRPLSPTPRRKPIALIGAGGHARVLLEALRLLGRHIFIAVDDNSQLHGTWVNGVQVAGGLEALYNYRPDEIELVNGIGSISQPIIRMQVYHRFVHAGYRFASVVHPSAIISESARLAPGVQIMASAIIQTHTQVGANVLVNTRSAVDHDCAIGAHTHLAPGTILSGSVTVGPTSHIGSGASVIQGIQIGHSVLVAAGAVVTRDVEAKTVVAGIPAIRKPS